MKAWVRVLVTEYSYETFEVEAEGVIDVRRKFQDGVPRDAQLTDKRKLRTDVHVSGAANLDYLRQTCRIERFKNGDEQ